MQCFYGHIRYGSKRFGKHSFRRAGQGSDGLEAISCETKSNPALIVMRAIFNQTTLVYKLFNQLATGGLMDSHAACELCYPQPRGSLDLLKDPHLGTGKTATLFHLTEILAHAAVDYPKLLQNIQGQLVRWCDVNIHDFVEICAV